ncbi:MAG: hypothetical protein ACLPPF_15325 [Rhodomicrobium sp.]
MTANATLRSTLGCQLAEMRELLKRANNLVNPKSGIANDFLNQYNELLFLLENLPILLPEMLEELLGWRPKTYEHYFQASPLPGGELAIKIYYRLDCSFRNQFESQIAEINKLAEQVIEVISRQNRKTGGLYAKDIEVFCSMMSKSIRYEIETASNFINHGLEIPPETSQEMADRIMQI